MRAVLHPLVVILLLAVCLINPARSEAQTSDTCITIKGNPFNHLFTQLNIGTYAPNDADASQTEIVSEAWTCNAIGFPTCNFRAILKFDISSIPAGAVITSARLHLYAKTNNINGNLGNPTFGTANTSLLQKITQSWTVGETGWANQPTTTQNGQRKLAQSTSTKENYTVNITDFVRSWVSDPSTNYGMMLRLQDETYYNSMVFNSGLAPDSLQPTLVICYSLGTPPPPPPPTDTCLTIKGNPTSHLFTQLNLATFGPDNADSSQTEIVSEAWTCNGIGYPTCNFRALLKFDVGAIPVGAYITSAKLYLHAKTNNINGNPGNPTFGTANTSLLQRITQPWRTAGTGWLNQPATTQSGQRTLPQSTTTHQNYTVNITDFVRGWVNDPSTNYGMMLRLENETYYNSMVFNSGLSPDSLQPTLIICYSLTPPPPPTDTCVTIKGNPNNHLFTQLNLATFGPNNADTSQTEIVSEAWTCNGIGYPTCNFRSLLKFDVSSIPSDVTITSAKLYLYAKIDAINGNPGNPTFGTANMSLLQKVVQPWATANTGWQNQPSTTSDGEKTLQQSTTTNQNYVVNVTDFVQGWVDAPTTNYGVMLRLQNEAYYNSMIFNSGQAASNLQPKLVICYTKNALPLTLKDFRGLSIQGKVNLSWTVFDGTSLANIAVERSADAASFTKIGQVSAINNAGEIKYSFVDNSITKLPKTYYRLTLATKDGRSIYSNTLVIATNNTSGVQIFPNPATTSLQVNLPAWADGKADLAIVNAYGQIISKYSYRLQPGNNSISINSLQHLASGVYMLRIVQNGQVTVKKFIKQ